MEKNKREVRAFISDAVASVDTDDIGQSEQDVMDFISENSWFGITPVIEGGKVFIPDGSTDDLTRRIHTFLRFNSMDNSQKHDRLKDMLHDRYAVLSEALSSFEDDTEVDSDTIYRLMEFLYEYMPSDLDQVNDDDLRSLMAVIFEDEYKYIGDAAAFFFAYAKDLETTGYNKSGQKIKVRKFRVKYTRDYIMEKRVDSSTQTSAYSDEEYMRLIYYLMNEEYAEDHEMYRKAAESKRYADTWLFLSIHFITAMRDPNLQIIYHPRLTYEPERVLSEIREGIFPSVEAKKISMALMEWMSVLQQKPKKTSATPNVPRVPFFIPVSLETHFGTLFAVCEAHHQLTGHDRSEPLIHPVKTYEQINRNMGEDIGSLFLERDFNTRRINKAYMQSIELFADPILANEGIDGAKNYVLVSLARSHKGGYNSFASTTAEYLKDANFSGLSVDFVSRELFERGILSSVVSMLLKIITGGDYSTYSPKEQTAMIRNIDISPSQAEALIKVSESAKKRAEMVVNKVLAISDGGHDEYLILTMLHRLACGEAPARDEDVYCICKSLTGRCFYRDKRPCQLGCEYEIGTKASAYHLMEEYHRLEKLSRTTSDEQERKKYLSIITGCILPLINDMLNCMGEAYGEEYLMEFTQILKDYE